MTERLPARIYIHAIPGAFVLLAAAWIVAHMQTVPASSADLIRSAPYYVFAIGLLLSAAFHRSRIFHALFLLVVCDVTLVLASARLVSPSLDVVVRVLGLLLPLNLVLVSLLPESGIFSRAGLIRLSAVAFQAIVAAYFISFYSGPALRFLNRPFLRYFKVALFHGLPQSVLLAFVLASFVLLFQIARRRFRPTDVGLYWALISSFVALCVVSSVRLSSTAFAAGAVVLVIALFEAFYTMAYFDELTDLPSRRSFNDAKLRLGGTYTVAMVDVDHFKQFNDTFGHDAGDQVLRMVASRISEVTGGGKGYRYGGEEFAVLFPGKCVDETFPHLERLRRSIEELPFKLRSQERRGEKKKRKLSLRRRRGTRQETNVTVSIGVAGVEGEKRRPDDLVKAADTALYRAKSCGRNCTIINEPEAVTA